MDAVRDIRQAAEAAETVVCRPAGDLRNACLGAFWLGIVVSAGAILGFFAWVPSAWLSFFTGFLASSFMTLPACIWATVYLRRACIIADARGLRWRGIGCWHTAAWKDVVAYSHYWPAGTSSLKRPLAKVQTNRGTLILSPGAWSLEAELRESITRNAMQLSQQGRIEAQNTTVTAGLNLPLCCRYDTAVNRNSLRWLDNLHKYGLAGVAAYFALQWLTMHTLPGWGWLLTPTGIFVIVKQTLPLVLRPLYRATQPRLGDKVIANEEGLRFITVQDETAVRWEDITDFYVVGIRYVVVTANGEYDFLNTLTEAERLRTVIPRLAVNAGQSAWRLTGGRSGTMHRRQVALANGDQSVQCRYQYRSPANCGQLYGVTLAVLFLAAVTLGPALIAWQSGSTPAVRELAAAMLGALGLMALLWLWAGYWLCAIRTDEAGVTQTTLLGSRRMAWSQVRGFRWRGSADLTWGYIEGMNGTLRFWKGIGDADCLAGEIMEHVKS